MGNSDFQAELVKLHQFDRDLRSVERLMNQVNEPHSEVHALLVQKKNEIEFERSRQLAALLRPGRPSSRQFRPIADSVATLASGVLKLVSRLK